MLKTAHHQNNSIVAIQDVQQDYDEDDPDEDLKLFANFSLPDLANISRPEIALTNCTSVNCTNEDAAEAENSGPKSSISYTVIVPLLIGACIITFCMNAIVVAAFPFVKNLSRVTRPYITFILSLVVSDAIASFLLGFQLLTGSYLPMVHGILINICFLFAAEAMKSSIIIITVLHLLVMVSIHLAGVVNPVRFKEKMTINKARLIVVLLWVVPAVAIFITFSAIPDQGFQSEGCQSYSFLTELPFRAGYSIVVTIPTAGILLLYSFFHLLLWKRRDVSKTSVSRQNIRAARVTFLIILTCTLGWIPAVVNHLLICASGCRYKFSDFKPQTLFIMHAISYILIILKSFSNPLIFAFRQSNIQRAFICLYQYVFHCKRDFSSLQRNTSHYSSFTRTSTNRERLSRRGGSLIARNRI